MLAAVLAAVAILGKVGLGGQHLFHDLPGVTGQDLPRLRGDDAPGAAVEQWLSDFLLELPDEKQLALETELRSTLPAESDGSIHLTARAWAVRGNRPTA